MVYVIICMREGKLYRFSENLLYLVPSSNGVPAELWKVDDLGWLSSVLSKPEEM